MKKKIKIALIILLIVLFIVGIIGGIIVGLNNNSRETEVKGRNDGLIDGNKIDNQVKEHYSYLQK